MLKFLQRLLLLAALCVPWATQAQCIGSECTISIGGTDEYGDGWNGASISVYQGTTLKGSFTLSDGASASATINVCTDDSVLFVWNEGDYDGECTFTILNGNGDTIIADAAGDTYSDGDTIAVAEVVCPSCIAPSGLQINVDDTDVELTWNASGATTWQIVWGPIGFNPDTVVDNMTTAASTPFTLSGLSDGAYEVYVRADCGSDGYSTWVYGGNFMVGGCILTIVGTDSYGDGWNNGTITATIGTQTATYTMTSGSSETWQVLVPNDTAVSFSWTAGSYDGEVSFVIYHQSGVILYSASYPTAGTFLTMSNPCSSCFAPGNLAIDSLTSDFARAVWAGSASSYGVIWGTSVDVLGDNGTETVSTDPYFEMDNLTSGTSYTIRVWTICDDNETSDTVTLTFATIGDAISVFPYSTGFEATDDIAWSFVNDATNKWFIGNATNNGGSSSLYVSNDNGTSNAYATSPTQFSYAYRPLVIADSGQFAISFDWKAYGESNYDYLRAWIAPAAAMLNAGFDPEGGTSAYSYTTSTPAGWIDLGGKMNLQSDWQTTVATPSLSAGSYNLVFMWANDGSGGSQPPAAVDNIMMTALTCPAPTALQATNVTSDSISVSWTAGGSEDTWIATIYPGGDTAVLSTTTYDFGDLQPNTVYTIRVYGICSGDDTSLATTIMVRTACGLITELPIFEDFETTGTTSSSDNSFIPCWTKVNNATSTFYPYVSNSTSYNHTPGGSNGLYWYRSSTAGSYGDYGIIVLPQLDTAALPLNTTMLTFWAKPSSTSYAPVLKVGAMQHPDSVATFQNVKTINIQHATTDWVKYTVPFNEFVDSIGCSYVAIRGDFDGSYWYLYVDDISLDSIPDCGSVEDLTVESGVTSAMLTWNVIGNSVSGAEIEYKEADATSWNNITVSSTNYAVLSGLLPDTTYNVRVSTLCGDANAIAVETTFQTGSFPCSQFDMTSLINATIGNGATTSSYVPSYSTYNYGYSQQFFTAHEIGGSGVITSLTLYPSAISQQRTFEIYMGTYADSASATYVNPTGLTCVYNGGHIPLAADQPVTFNLTTPFDYNGTSNLVVIFRDMTGSWVSGNAWYGDNAWSNASAYNYQDSGPYTVPYTGSPSSTLTFRNKITFFGGTCLQTSTCAAPIPYVSAIDVNTADVVWAPGNVETSWNLYFRQVGATNYTFAGTANTNSYQFTGLASGTPYEFMVVPVCADSISASVRATTECAEIASLPFFEDFNGWGVGSGVMPNCWYRTGSYSTYTYISGSQNMTGTTGGSIYMYQSGASHSTLFLPALDTTVYQVNQTQLVFNVMNTSDNYLHPGFEIGVLSDPMDISTFVPVDTVYHTVGPNVWQVFEVSLANYTGNGTYIGLRTADNPNSGTQYTYTYFYLDDVTLELIPNCQRPDSLGAGNATTTSVDLSWHERSGASQWQIEYGPIGFTLGTGTTMIVNSNPFTLTGLPVSYQGEFYVKSICGAGDTGEYSRTSYIFSVNQTPATLPYTYNFEDATEWGNWQVMSNATNNWYRGTAIANGSTASMYISADTGATYTPYDFDAVVNAAAYRDIDFGNVQSSFTVSFDARVGGTLDASYDGLMLFLVDPSVEVLPTTRNITTPWGNVNDLYRIATVRLDTTWQTYTASFDTISGVKRVAFFWFNQNTGENYTNWPEPAAVDNIHIEESACPRPVATTVTSVGATNATLSWVGPASATYEVIYRPYPNGTNSFAQTNTNSITLTGLASTTQYAVWVRKICGTDTSLTSDGVLFTTELCDNATTVTNFDSTMSTGTSSYSPIGYSTYNYSYTQTIIDSAQLAGLADAGDITAMGFSPASTSAGDYFTNITVYLTNLPDSLGDLSSSFILPSADLPFVKVIDNADFSYTTTSLQLHGFDTTFTWDGTSRILVSVVRNHGAWTSGSSFNAHTQTSGHMRYAYTDSAPYDYTTVTGGTASTTVGDIYLISCGAGCPTPAALSATNVTYNSATLNWSSSATDFEVAWKATTEATWPTPVAVSGATTYAVTGLVPETAYQFMVRALCDTTEGLVSDWVIGTFTTAELPCFVPTALQADPDYTDATFSWTAGGEETAWTLHIWNSAFDQEYDVTANPYTATGLTQNTTYNAAIKAVCGGGAAESEYGDTISFTTSTCAVVTGVVATATSATTATVTWNATEATSYEVNYGPRGFQTGDGEFVTVTTASANLTGLNPQSNYDVYVRALCGTGVQSNWSEAAQFSTPAGEGISTAEGTSLSIYPNPTTSATTIALSSVNGEVTITIVDMNGRVLMSDSMSCEGDCTKTMEVSGLAQGAYFVRISGESTNMVKKLVVK